MFCPRCNAIFEERFCPQCGLDLQIYAEMEALKREVEALRQIVVSAAQPKPELATGSASAKERSAAEVRQNAASAFHRALTEAGQEKSMSGG